MADKQIEIEVVTKADLAGLEDLSKSVDDVKESASEGIELESNAGEVASDFDELGSSASDAANSVDETGNSLNNVDGSNAQNAGSDVSDLGTEADKASENVGNLANSLGMIEAGAMIGVANELSSIGSSAEGMAQEMNTAAITVGQLATQTGVAEPQMVSLVSTISNATFPQSEAMMYIKSLDQMGVSAENFGASATGLDRINDAFHLGAERTNSLGQELGVLGVDMNNVSSSFNALAYANANTVGGMDNYYTFLKKYDAQFNELGYDVDQASMIIAAATQKYGGGRAALSGLSEALKNADGDTRKLEESLGMQAGSLDNASQITGEYAGQLDALADEEAEHKTWLDQLGAAWEDVTLKMSPVLSPLASFMGLLGQAGSYAVGINGLITLYQNFQKLELITRISGYMSGLKTGLLNVASSAKTALLNVANFARTLATTVYTAVVNAAKAMWELGIQVLTAGYNALKSAAMWVAEKASLVASTIATWAAQAAQWALNVAMSMNPIGLLVIAILGLIAVLGYLYYNNETVRQAIDGLAATIMGVLSPVIDFISGLFQNFTNQLGLNTNDWVQAVLGFILFLPTLPLQIGIALTNAIAKALGFKGNFVQTLWNTATDAVSKFANAINGIVTAVQSCLDWAYQVFMSHPIVQAAVWLGQAIANGFSALGLGQHSPGKIVQSMNQELDWTQEAIERSKLPYSAASLGSDLADSFNPNFETSNFNSVSGGVPGNTVINIEIGSVDNDERVNEIVDAVRRALSWDNRTAGRTV